MGKSVGQTRLVIDFGVFGDTKVLLAGVFPPPLVAKSDG